MIAIRLTFPAARYHATPWGRHVNEGVPEWPPSPYRLLRALYDVWQRKCFELEADAVRGVLEGLASCPPRFALPKAVAMHTRSYLSANAFDPSDKNLVFDPFLVFDRRHECFISWETLEFSDESRATLGRLLTNMNYLGRSESWVQADLWNGPVQGDFVCDVLEGADVDGELVSVGCTVPVTEYEGKTSWLDALTFSTTQLLKQRASSPPLLKEVRYLRPEAAIATDPPRRLVRRPSAVSAVLLSLDATVLPLVTATLEVAEQIRTRLMGAHRRRMGNDPTKVSPLFSGKSAEGEKRLDHGHVYILPLQSESNEPSKQGRIDRVLIFRRADSSLDPFKEDELDAVRGVRELWQRDGRPMVKCVVTWQGSSVEPPERRLARTVISSTPFVPPRRWRKGRDFKQFLIEEIRRECRNHSVGFDPTSVEIVERLAYDRFDVVEYRRNRKDDPVRPGYAFRLTFPEPVLAPFAIGYGAHFGLGQFRPVHQLT